MKKPDDLTQLLAELKEEGAETTVACAGDKPGARILFDDENIIDLSKEEALLLFSTPRTVKRLFEALGSPEECSIELSDMTVETNVTDSLEARFMTVDIF